MVKNFFLHSFVSSDLEAGDVF